MERGDSKVPLGIAPPLVACACFEIKCSNMPSVRALVFYSSISRVCVEIYKALEFYFGQQFMHDRIEFKYQLCYISSAVLLSVLLTVSVSVSASVSLLSALVLLLLIVTVLFKYRVCCSVSGTVVLAGGYFHSSHTGVLDCGLHVRPFCLHPHCLVIHMFFLHPHPFVSLSTLS